MIKERRIKGFDPNEKLFLHIKNRIFFYGSSLIPSQLRQYSYKYFIKNAFWSILGAILLRSQIIIISIFLSRILPIGQFGQVGLLRSTIGTFSIFASIGVSIGATKFISKSLAVGTLYIKSWVRFTYLITFIAAGLFGLGVYLFASPISASVLGDDNFTYYLRLSAIVIFINSVLTTQIGILNGFQKFKRVALLNLYGALVGFPLQVFFSWRYGIEGFLVGNALTTLIQMGFYHFIIVKLQGNINGEENKSLYTSDKWAFINFCVPAALSGFLVTPVSWYCNTVLVKGRNGYSEMAFFEIANNWRMILIFIPATISQVLLPNITAIFDKIRLKKLLYFNMLINAAIALGSALVLILLSPYLLRVYGNEYVKGSYTFNIVIASTVFVSVASVTGQLIAGKMKMWYGFLLNIIWAAFIIALSHYFIKTKSMGAEGLALAYFLSYCIHTVLQAMVFWFYFKTWKEPVAP